MKRFKQLIAEVAQPKSKDELNFKDKHEIEMIDHPESEEHQHTSDKPKAKRLADYKKGEDMTVYEAKVLFKTSADSRDELDDLRAELSTKYRGAKVVATKNKSIGGWDIEVVKEAKMDPVNPKELKKDFKDREDKDIDNDGDVDSSDEYLHNRRKAISKAMRESIMTRIGLAEKKTDDAIWMVTWKQKNTGNDGREYMDSTQFHKTEREARLHKGKLKHDPRVLRNSAMMKKVKSRDMGEEVELDEAKTDIYHKHMLKALGKSRLPKNHQYTSEVSSTSGDFIVRDGGGRIVGRIPKGEHNLKESTDLNENFKSGSLTLRDGSKVVVNKKDADLLNQMFKDLNAQNRREMMKVAMTDKAGFEEIRGFAREAL
jgi:hypothetical protein